MSADDVKTEILEPMQRLFEPRRGLTEAGQIAVLRDYVDALQNYDAKVLETAWVDIRSTHDRAGWPNIAALLGACRRASKALNPSVRSGVDREMEDRIFVRFCELRGLNPNVMRRPNLWWMAPRQEWKPGWHEGQIPPRALR